MLFLREINLLKYVFDELQKRFLSSGAQSPTKVSWWIPLSVMCESEVGQKPDPVQWLANNEGVETRVSVQPMKFTQVVPTNVY